MDLVDSKDGFPALHEVQSLRQLLGECIILHSSFKAKKNKKYRDAAFYKDYFEYEYAVKDKFTHSDWLYSEVNVSNVRESRNVINKEYGVDLCSRLPTTFTLDHRLIIPLLSATATITKQRESENFSLIGSLPNSNQHFSQ